MQIRSCLEQTRQPCHEKCYGVEHGALPYPVALAVSRHLAIVYVTVGVLEPPPYGSGGAAAAPRVSVTGAILAAAAATTAAGRLRRRRLRDEGGGGAGPVPVGLGLLRRFFFRRGLVLFPLGC